MIFEFSHALIWRQPVPCTDGDDYDEDHHHHCENNFQCYTTNQNESRNIVHYRPPVPVPVTTTTHDSSTIRWHGQRCEKSTPIPTPTTSTSPSSSQHYINRCWSSATSFGLCPPPPPPPPPPTIFIRSAKMCCWLMALCWAAACIVNANQLETSTTSRGNSLSSTIRHRLYGSQQHNERHHYYHQHHQHHNHHHHHHPHHHNHHLNHQRSSQSPPPPPQVSNSSSSSSQFESQATTSNSDSRLHLSPYSMLHQMVRQQHITSRQRHPYYYFYEHDLSTNDNTTTDLNPIRDETLRRWNSHRQHRARHLINTQPVNIIYQQNGITSEEQLPICETWQVCNKVDTYSTPWIEKQCRCPSTMNPCSKSLTADDGHTIVEKHKQYKICEPVRKLPTCRYFRDITWTITTTSVKSEKSLNALLASASSGGHHHHQHQFEAENITQQEMKCHCPPNSVAYIFKHNVHRINGQPGYRYHFACSPETKLRCKRKEPCRLFTVRKRPKVEEVTSSTLCQCSGGYSCPANHRHPSVLLSTSHSLDNFRTYSAYCYPDVTQQHQQQPNTNKDDVTTTTSTTTSEYSSLDDENNDDDDDDEKESLEQSAPPLPSPEVETKANIQQPQSGFKSIGEIRKYGTKYNATEEKYLISFL